MREFNRTVQILLEASSLPEHNLLLRKAFKSLQLSEPSQIRWDTSTLFPGPFPTFVDVFRNPVSLIPRSTKSEVGSASSTVVDPVASKRTSSALDNLGRISKKKRRSAVPAFTSIEQFLEDTDSTYSTRKKVLMTASSWFLF